MQGTMSPHAAIVLATICVGLMLVYFGIRRMLALMDKDDREQPLWGVWRFVSGIGCASLSAFVFFILMAMTNDADVIAFCRANGLNPSVVLLTLFLLSVASAMLNDFLPDREMVLSWSGRKVTKKPRTRARIVPDVP